ncbi:MAG: hypothetical protein H7281_07505 [Bacteriovorax sp.]|nr:hypothetical protein [Bacteriovorax sp.]
MNGLKVLMGLMVVSLMSTSCVSLNGNIDVKQMMAAKKKSGFLNLKTTEIQIQPGLYSAELKINSDKNYTLKLDGQNKILIPIKASKDLNVPSNGHVFMSHNDINQPFDLSGEISTDIQDSDRTDAVEDCTFTVTENHCQKICDKPDACSIVCKDVQVTINGRHEVSFHYRTTHRDLSIDFLKADKPEVLASFHGTDTETDRITDYSGVCR